MSKYKPYIDKFVTCWPAFSLKIASLESIGNIFFNIKNWIKREKLNLTFIPDTLKHLEGKKYSGRVNHWPLNRYCLKTPKSLKEKSFSTLSKCQQHPNYLQCLNICVPSSILVIVITKRISISMTQESAFVKILFQGLQ